MTREVLSPRGEPFDVVFLNSHVVKLPFKYLSLYNLYCSKCGQRSFLLQWVWLMQTLTRLLLFKGLRVSDFMLSFRWDTWINT